jgi:KDO2-lipid IV(A) lauroyltransferase
MQHRAQAEQKTGQALRDFIRKIPHRKIDRLGRILGLIFFMLDPRHRRIVRRNLKFAYPEWSWDRVLKVTRQVYQNFGVALLEILQSLFFTRADVLGKVHVGRSGAVAALKNTGNMLMITAHLGNWEMALQFAACYLRTPPVAVARTIANPTVDRWVHRIRTRFGAQIITKKGGLPDMTRALRNGRVLALLIDQGMKAGEGVEVRFFGHKVKATSAVAMLAMRCKSGVIPAFCVRDNEGLRVIVDAPLKLQRTRNMRADILANTQMMLDAIEKAIRAYPEQWFWFHKRWKVHYPHLYREDLERKRRQREKQRKKILRGETRPGQREKRADL